MTYKDMTFCGFECANTKCERNKKHILEGAKYVSLAYFHDCEEFSMIPKQEQGVKVMNKIEELEQKLNECQKELAELKESKKEKWKPKYGEEYWYRDIYGEFIKSRFDGDSIDCWLIKNIPIFKTDKECRKYWNFMDTVKEKSYKFSKEEWENISILKWYIYCRTTTGEMIISNTASFKDLGKIYFKTKDDTEYIINNFKEELFKYWL